MADRMMAPSSVTFIRHARTEMNDFDDPWVDGFVDRVLYDTRLSHHGIQACKELNAAILANPDKYKSLYEVDMILVSPLSRTLHTAELVLANVFTDDQLNRIERIVCPLARERLYISSEVGSLKPVLVDNFPSWDYSLLPDSSPWWYTGPEDPSTYVEWRPKGSYVVHGEPLDVFIPRMKKFKRFLESLEARKVLIVTHWGVVASLTGKTFSNLEIGEFELSALFEEPIDDSKLL